MKYVKVKAINMKTKKEIIDVIDEESQKAAKNIQKTIRQNFEDSIKRIVFNRIPNMVKDFEFEK